MLEIIKRTYNYLRVRSAVKTAKRLNSQTGKKYYILQIHGKLRVLTRIQGAGEKFRGVYNSANQKRFIRHFE